MKFLKWLALILLILIVVYFLGPAPKSPRYTNDLPAIPDQPELLEAYIKNKESAHKLKPDNEARILWINDSSKQMTEYAVVYLHGFSASQEEGDPIHYSFARKFGCNLYLPRFDEHGIDTSEPMLNLTAEKLWSSAKEAYAVGKRLGKRLILLSSSTGGSLALKLAAEYPDIAGLILLAPSIAINDPNAWVLNNHWGLEIARMVKGKYNVSSDTTAIYKQYWTYKYRMEAAVQLEEFLETTMKASVFEKVTQPTLLLYYYKDEDHQDNVVKVSAMKRMFRQLGTAPALKREMAIPNAANHVIGSYIKSKDIQSVDRECERFGKETLHLKQFN
jgi:esterase/lipase